MPKFTADLARSAMVHEMGALMVAIVMAGEPALRLQPNWGA